MFARFLPVGFYYKAFHNKRLFPMWERVFRRITGLGVVDRIITDLAVLDITAAGLELVEMAPGVDFDQLQAATGCAIRRQ